MKLMKILKLPPVMTVVGMLAAYLLDRYLPIYDLNRVIAPRFGYMGIAFGAALILWSAVHFVRNKTPIEPGHTPTVLLTSGPFQMNRNPIYTGMVLMLFSVGIILGGITSLIPTVVFFWAVTRFHIIPEEEALRQTFGKAGEDFLANTHRWG